MTTMTTFPANNFTNYIPKYEWDIKTNNYIFNDSIYGVIHPMIRIMEALNYGSGYFAARNNKYVRTSSHKNCRFGSQGNERFLGNYCVLGLIEKKKRFPSLLDEYPSNPETLTQLEFEEKCLTIILSEALIMFDWYPYFSWPKFLSYLGDFRKNKGQMPYAKDILINFFTNLEIPIKHIHKIIKSEEPPFIADKDNGPKKPKGYSLDAEDKMSQWGVYYHSRWWYKKRWYEINTEEAEDIPLNDLCNDLEDTDVSSSNESNETNEQNESNESDEVPESWEDDC